MLPSNIPNQNPEDLTLNPDRNLHIYGVEDCGEIVKLHWIDGANGEKGYTAITRERFNGLFVNRGVIDQIGQPAKYLTAEDLMTLINNAQEANESPAQEGN